MEERRRRRLIEAGKRAGNCPRDGHLSEVFVGDQRGEPSALRFRLSQNVSQFILIKDNERRRGVS